MNLGSLSIHYSLLHLTHREKKANNHIRMLFLLIFYYFAKFSFALLMHFHFINKIFIFSWEIIISANFQHWFSSNVQCDLM